MIIVEKYKKQKSAGSVANRRENVKGKFKAEHTGDLSGKTAVLLDDVFTTGATLLECAKTLFDAGIAKIFPVCLSFHVFATSIKTTTEREVLPCPGRKTICETGRLRVRSRNDGSGIFFGCYSSPDFMEAVGV